MESSLSVRGCTVNGGARGGLQGRVSLCRMGEGSHEEGGRTFLLFSNVCLLSWDFWSPGHDHKGMTEAAQHQFLSGLMNKKLSF